MSDDESTFDQFWDVSSLDRFNVQQFSQQLNAYDSDDKELYLNYPEEPTNLPTIKSQVNKISKKRKSTRSFSNKQLTIRELSKILSSFYAWNGLEHRAYPSAGATYVTEIFCIAFNVETHTGDVIYYDPERHGLVVVSNCAPSWSETSESLNMNIEGTPQLLIIFTAFPDRAVAKYGERGGRFALLEIGAAMQQLSLQIAESSDLKGVAVGGMLDNIWKQHLQLGSTNAKVVLGYLVGK